MMASVRPVERNASETSETSKVRLRFSEVTEVLSMQTPTLNNVVHIDNSNAADPWFDWNLLERAEAQERSKSAPPRRPERIMSPDGSFKAHQEKRAEKRRKRRSTRRESGKGPRLPSPPPAVPVVPATPASPSTESTKSSEKQCEGSGESFRAWLDQRPAMLRLSGSRCETGVAWDFPLTKSEKRELLLQHIAATERIAEEHAVQAAQEVELAWEEEQRHRQSLASAKAAISRMRKKGRKPRLSLGT
eukprot:symbB.v1.2.021239.t1/scaffold1825.1/size102390/6